MAAELFSFYRPGQIPYVALEACSGGLSCLGIVKWAVDRPAHETPIRAFILRLHAHLFFSGLHAHVKLKFCTVPYYFKKRRSFVPYC
jgi:hypothetical protein